MSELERVISRILQREGGLSNHPDDRGGLTKYGITLPFLSDAIGRAALPSEVAGLTEMQARQVYRDWMHRINLDAIQDVRLLDAVADYAVLSGARTAIKALQRALDVNADGIIGHETINALDDADPAVVRNAVLAARVREIGQIIQREPRQAVFLRGWLARIANVLEA